MNVTITDQEGCKKQVRLEIPGDAVRAQTDKVITDLARRVTLPGFRPGHVPKSVVRTRFQKEVRDEVVSQLLPDALRDAIGQNELRVVGEPELDDLKFGDDESLNVTFVVEVVPQFELSNYKNLPIKKTIHKISDASVDSTIEGLRRQHAELVPVEDRPSQRGDIVTTSIKGRIENAEKPDESTEVSEPELEIELDDKALKEFSDALTGVRPGDNREFVVAYPEDYQAQRLAGKRVAYAADVTAVRVKELPDLDDEFAQVAMSGSNTMEELRNTIRRELEQAAEHETRDKLQSATMDELVKRNSFNVPDYVVEKQMDSRLRNMVRQMASRGIDPRQFKFDWEAFRESQRERAENEVRGLFVLERIAAAEGIDVSEAEFNEELEKLAKGAGTTVASLKARLTKENALDSIKEQIKNRKALEFVISSADIRTVEVEGLGGKDESGGDSPAVDVSDDESRSGDDGDEAENGIIKLK